MSNDQLKKVAANENDERKYDLEDRLVAKSLKKLQNA
jgi:hypothetical protein